MVSYKRIWVVVLFLVAPVFGGASSISGYWLNSDAKVLVEFSGSKAQITWIDQNGVSYVFEKRALDESTFELRSGNLTRSITGKVNAESDRISIESFPTIGKELTFTRAPSINGEDLYGVWLSAEKDGEKEELFLVTLREGNYDFEKLAIDHGEKTFSRYVDKNINFEFKNGFMFVDGAAWGFPYIYLVTSFEDDVMHYLDFKGLQWTQKRVDAAYRLSIPDGYTNVSHN